MKKVYLVIVFVSLICSKPLAQIFADSFINYSPPVKYEATIQLKNDSVCYGRIEEIDTASLVLSGIKTKTSESFLYDSIPWADIQTIKVKRSRFLEGLGMGIIGGALLGYFVGSKTYQYDYSISESANNDAKSGKGFTSALIVSIPSGLLGALIGSIALKVRFTINGKRKNALKMIDSLW